MQTGTRKLHALLKTDRPYWIDLFVIVSLGLCLRLLLLGSKSLWLDEALGLHIALNGQQRLWAGQSESYHPPLYYWLLEGWMQLGHSEFSLRLLSVIPATLSLPVLYLLVKDWLGEGIALSSAALMAFSPLLVWYAQELRSYALLALLGLLSLLFVSRLFQRPGVVWWGLFVATMVAALYLHYVAILLVPLQALFCTSLLAARCTTWRAVLYWLAGTGAAFLAWRPWLLTPAFDRFLTFAFSDRNYVAILFADRLGLSLDMASIALVLVAVGALVVGGWYFFARALLNNRHFQILHERTWVKVVASVVFVVLLVVSVVPRGYSLKRQFVLFWPYSLVFFAWLWPWRRSLRAWLMPMVLLSLTAAVINVVAIPKPQWREANAAIVYYQQENDIVLLEPSYMVLPFDYYNAGQSKREGVSYGAGPTQIQAFLDENERVWLIMHQADNDPQQRNATWLDAHAVLVGTIDFYRLHLRLYESGITLD